MMKKPFIFVDYTKIMVIGGVVDDSPSTEYLDSVEVLDFSSDSPDCGSVANYPLAVTFSTGDLVDGRPRVCGGYDGTAVTNMCYEYITESNQWQDVAPMQTPRYVHKSSKVDSATWFITGGYDLTTTFDTTEVWQNGEFTYGPRLPFPLRNHCQLTLDASYILILGGYNGTAYINSFHMLDWKSADWIPMPDTPFTLGNDVCGIIEHSENGQELVIMQHGNTPSQIFNFGDNTWREGPTMGEPISYEEASVQMNHNFVTLGGRLNNNAAANNTDSVYEFDEEGYRWVTKAATLQTKRQGAVAIAVPDELVDCD